MLLNIDTVRQMGMGTGWGDVSSNATLLPLLKNMFSCTDRLRPRGKEIPRLPGCGDILRVVLHHPASRILRSIDIYLRGGKDTVFYIVPVC